MERFSQKTSITRTLGLAILGISVLFAIEFLGFYLASGAFLDGLSAIHRVQLLINSESELRQSTDSIQAVLLRPMANASIRRENQKVFLGIRDHARAALRRLDELTSEDPKAKEFVTTASISLDELHAAATRFYAADNQVAMQRENLVAREFASDAAETLDRFKVFLSQRSDSRFTRIYEARYRPFAIAIALAAICMVLSLGGGLRLTHRLRRAVEALLEATREVANGKMEVRAPVLSRDEIGSLANAFNEMTETLRQRDEFLAVASHELKTPLTSLILQLQLLRRELAGNPATERAAQSASMAESQGQRLVGLLDGLLDLTRIRLGQVSLRAERVDLVELARSVLARFGPEAQAMKIPLRLRASGPAPGVWDPVRLEQVIENLVSNAVKYGNGTPVEVLIDAAPGERYMLAVTDRGKGVPPEMRERIFQRFERLDASTGIAGHGLGLFICRQIVEAHGGTIRVEGVPGGGSAFIVELPVSGGQAKAA